MTMDNELFKWLAGLGVGGILAGLIFIAYRKDVKSYTDLWKESTGMLIAALKESTAAHVMNTASNQEMIGLLRAVHRRLDAEQLSAGYSNDENRPTTGGGSRT